MKKIIFSVIAAGLIAAGVGLFVAEPTNAQAAECEVSGQHGAIFVSGNNAVADFSIDGAANCTETEVSLAVWVCTPAGCTADLQNQWFFGATSDFYDLNDAQDRVYAKIARITTALPTEKLSGDGCELQIDLVRGDERADPNHQFPNGPFYDGRRMLTSIVANPACEEPVEVQVCNTQTGEIITVAQDQQNNFAPADDEACDTPSVVVCNASTGELISVPETQADDFEPRDSEECKTPGKVAACNTETGKIIQVSEDEADDFADVNDDACKKTVTKVVTKTTPPPRQPKELPNTGAGAVASVMSVPFLGGAFQLYRSSKGSLLDALLNK